MVKNERVARSNKKPITNVLTNVEKPLSTSEKFHTKKLSLTTKERMRKRETNAFKVAKRLGKMVYFIEVLKI